MILRFIKIALFLAVLAGAGYYFVRMQQSAVVAVIKPLRGPAVEAIYATGTVEPSVMVPVSPRSPARLMQLFADEGMRVTKDQVLAQMEDADLQNVVEEAQANLALAEKEYNRRSALAKRDAAPKDVVDQALGTLDAARAKFAQAQANLSYMKLLSPEDGLVIRRDGEVGELITANQPVFYLSCCKGLRISAEVDEEDIAQVTTDQKVLISADAFPGKVFEGKVDSITPKGDPVARSYRVRINLPTDTLLMIGMTAESNIVLREEKNALLLPASALHEGKVRVLRDGKLQQQAVKTGAVTPKLIEILEGVTDADIVMQDISKEIGDDETPTTDLQDWTLD